jgi:hypothetical protein
MTPRSLFAIIIKIIGLNLIVNAFITLPQWASFTFINLEQIGHQGILPFVLLLVLAFYILILICCLFRTDWLINNLHLDRGFSEEKLELNIHRSTVLKISVIVIGAVMLIDYLPVLCEHTFAYFQMGGPDHGFKDNPNSKYIVFDLVKIFAGFFFVTSSRLIVNFIERQRKRPTATQQTTD